MNEQHRDQQHGQHSQDQKREAPGAGHQQHQRGAEPNERAMRGEKPKTEKASHQGGGSVRTDHLPQGK